MTITKAVKEMRIHVLSPDKEDLGLATIVDVVDLADEETGEVVSTNFPIIKLDSGDEITGLDCFWTPMIEV